ncbi:MULTISPECIES: shikimate kinase [Collinsella]|uniref:shikimate kinase n=1 Tax=Collinsella TaxID=102106 RepID=UPI000B3996EF|nr:MULTISPECIES: shikimate kinase [Collinsella]MBM6683028.1 shikimate kinase [Collinsella intestinalis]OUN47375.1 shikimate kinase [Collinsella sp. An7]
MGGRSPGGREHVAGPSVKHGCDHIFFIGFLGAGKSTLARNLGKMFHRPFVDTDRMVERRAGASVARVFRSRGEAGFRKLETEVLRSLKNEQSLLVSCGGGVVETPENIRLMREMGTVVYLEGDFADSLRQIRSVAARPDFKSRAHAERLFEHRRPLYVEAADLTLDIRGKSFEDVSYRCAEMLLERGLI